MDGRNGFFCVLKVCFACFDCPRGNFALFEFDYACKMSTTDIVPYNFFLKLFNCKLEMEMEMNQNYFSSQQVV